MLRLLIVSRLSPRVLPVLPAGAQPIVLMPGVTYEKQVQFTLRGPVVVHVLTAPRPGGLYSLEPVLSDGTIPGTKTLTAMQADLATTGTLAGVNGERFQPDGRPVGMLMRGGALDSVPLPVRSSVGIGADGTLHVGRVTWYGIWKGTGQRRPLGGVNAKPGTSGAILYTPAWGAATPPGNGLTEAVIQPLPPLTPGPELSGQVTQVGPTSGGTPIPAGGAVLVTTGAVGKALLAEAPAGTTMTIRLALQPDWSPLSGAIGAGPLLVQNGVGVSNAGEAFTPDQLVPRTARTAVGQLADGRIVLVVVDGGRIGYSVGMTNFELAEEMVQLGCVTAAALDSGDSSAMAFDAGLLSRPSGTIGERAISTSLDVVYTGVYAPPPTTPVLSPNGDGVAEQESLSYRLPRPATVTATLTGPDGQPRITDTGAKQPGTYPFVFTGRLPDGTPDQEGTYLWSITATDDRGIASSAQQSFTLNDTLASLSVAPPLVRASTQGSTLAASFTLAHPAQVSVTIESQTGALVRTLEQTVLQPGSQTLTWDGRDDRGEVVYSGVYVLRVAATGPLGRVDLTQTIRVRHVAATAPNGSVQAPAQSRTTRRAG